MDKRSHFLQAMGIQEWQLRTPAAPVSAPADLDMWQTLAHEVAQCMACGLCQTRKQTVFGVGARPADWVVVGEAPGAEEDARGEPFVGQAGQLLDHMLATLGLQRGVQVFIANVLKCRPPGNRDPLPEEVQQCAPFLERQLMLLNPKIVLVAGRFAAQTLLATDTAIGKLRGRVHYMTIAERRIPVVATYHPAYLLRNPADKAKAWADLCLAQQTYAALKV